MDAVKLHTSIMSKKLTHETVWWRKGREEPTEQEHQNDVGASVNNKNVRFVHIAY